MHRILTVTMLMGFLLAAETSLAPAGGLIVIHDPPILPPHRLAYRSSHKESGAPVLRA